MEELSLKEAKLAIGDILLSDMFTKKKILIDPGRDDVSLFRSTLIAGVEEGEKFVTVHAYYRLTGWNGEMNHREWVPDYYEVHDGFDEGE